jgi:hypothetical protein
MYVHVFQNVSRTLGFSNVRKSSKLSFRLYARRYVHEDKFIGEVGKRVDRLVEDSTPFVHFLNELRTELLKQCSSKGGIALRILTISLARL